MVHNISIPPTTTMYTRYLRPGLSDLKLLAPRQPQAVIVGGPVFLPQSQQSKSKAGNLWITKSLTKPCQTWRQVCVKCVCASRLSGLTQHKHLPFPILLCRVTRPRPSNGTPAESEWRLCTTSGHLHFGAVIIDLLLHGGSCGNQPEVGGCT